MSSLSLIIIAKNADRSIGRCIESVSLADQIVVVDNGSVDRTAEIAKEMGAQVISSPEWYGFGRLKQQSLDSATGNWVLSLDADEWIEEALAAEIGATILSPQDNVGYEIPRRSRFCGKVVRYCGWQPDYVLRLFKRKKGRFTDDIVHEKVVVDGKVGRLLTPIEHEPIVDLDDVNRKIEAYSTAAAQQLLDSGARSSIFKALVRGAWAFTNAYVLKRGFLDSSVGLMVSSYQARYTYQKWARVAAANRSTD